MVQAAAQTEMSTWSSVVPEINTDPCCYMDTDPSMALSVSTSHNITVASGGRADTHIWQFLSTLKSPSSSTSLHNASTCLLPLLSHLSTTYLHIAVLLLQVGYVAGGLLRVPPAHTTYIIIFKSKILADVKYLYLLQIGLQCFNCSFS